MSFLYLVFHNLTFFFRRIIAIFLLIFNLHYVKAEIDNNSSFSNLFFTAPNGDNELLWLAYDLESKEVSYLGAYAQQNSQVHIGNYEQINSRNRSFVTRDTRGQFRLYVETSSQPVYLGTAQENSVVILGRDSNHSGTLDATLVVPKDRIWSWRFTFDPFSKSRAMDFKRTLFGSKNGLPFQFRSYGGYDSLAILIVYNGQRRSQIIYKSLKSKLLRKIRLKNIQPAKLRPLTIPRGNIAESIGVYQIDEDGKKTLVEINTRGKIQNTSIISEADIPVIADFNGDGRSEIGLFNYLNSSIKFKEDEIFLQANGLLPISAFEVKSYESNTVTENSSNTEYTVTNPTQNPQLTQTVIYTATPTLTLNPILPPANTLTPTIFLTNTSTPILTPTPSATFTAIPSPSNTMTYTPTVTPSNTNTLTPSHTPTPTRTLGSGFPYTINNAVDYVNGYGITWGDFDNDNDLDIYLANDGSVNKLYRNDGNNSFVNIAQSANVDDNSNSFGASSGDFDNDGDLDIFVSNFGSASRLFRNNGNNTFTDVASSAGVNFSLNSRISAWGDFDGDNDLDLFVSAQGGTALFRNNGNSTFTDVSVAAGVNSTGSTRSVAWGDFNSDGFLDIYVASSSNNLLYRNNGNGTFTDVAFSAGVDDSADSYGVAWGDFDGDKDLDLYVANANLSCRFYRNNNNGTFTNIAAAAGVTNGLIGIGAAWSDFDGDGDLDIYVANNLQANRLYRNNGDNTFTDVAAIFNVADARGGVSVAFADFDLDGDEDFYLTNDYNGGNVFYVNGLNPYQSTYLSVKVLSATQTSNQYGIKVNLKTTSGGIHIATRTIDGGSGAYSQSSTPINFYNLNPATSYDLEIFWTDGSTNTYTLGTPDGTTKKVCKGLGIC